MMLTVFLFGSAFGAITGVIAFALSTKTTCSIIERQRQKIEVLETENFSLRCKVLTVAPELLGKDSR